MNKTPHQKSHLATISPQKINDFLTKNPDFFLQYPDLLEKLTIPPQWQKNPNMKILDFRSALISQLQKNLALRDLQNYNIISIYETNENHQNRIHNLILQILATDSLQATLAMLAKEMPQTLDLEKVVLCVAPHKNDLLQDMYFENLRIIDSKWLQEFNENEIVIKAHISDDHETECEACHKIYGTANIHSDLRIAINLPKVKGFLAFGSNFPNKFNTEQSTQLMVFLTRSFEAMIKIRITDHQ